LAREGGVKTKLGLQFEPMALLDKAGEGRAASSYASGQVIFAQGDPADAVFYVETGRVKLTIVSGQGKEAVVGIYSATDLRRSELSGSTPPHRHRHRDERVPYRPAGEIGHDPHAS
jgi:CRP-like cAMP-binding protein